MIKYSEIVTQAGDYLPSRAELNRLSSKTRGVASEMLFLTGSRYSGHFERSTRTMDGFGIYTFPDGAEYRGYFNKGNFDGYGLLKLAPPNKFTFKGIFERGELVKIEEMLFGDGLVFKADVNEDNTKINTSEWNYCTSQDRRFTAELYAGLQPFGPKSFVSPQRPSRPLPPKSFDTEQGVYKPSTGFVGSIPKPFPKQYFLAIPAERKWIEEHCRAGPQDAEKRTVVTPSAKFRKIIMETNFKAMKIMEDDYKCPCNDRELSNLYLRGPKEREARHHSPSNIGDSKYDDMPARAYTDSSEDTDSITDVSLVDDLTARCYDEVVTLRREPQIFEDENNSAQLMSMLTIRK